ncbi:hypothetical protein OAT25_01750 [Candidatus Pelagibacter sp.]|nr:hypothetical protein [Candidatus Pelagibacter sp.]
MQKQFNKNFFLYLSILFFFSVIYLIKKHNVGNDSTISEWLINYQGGFTKRGLIGQLNIYLANFFKINLREAILFFQITLVGFYFYLLFKFFKNIEINKIVILSIFTPVFILYPVAEIEVLARKEIFIFCIFIIYVCLKNRKFYNLSKSILLILSILIWEPVIFYFPFFLVIDIFKKNMTRIDKEFLINLSSYIPAILLAFYIALYPIEPNQHDIMSNFLKKNFNEACYMSCALLKTKSSIYSQFQGNFKSYSFEVFFRYFFIIFIGFGPLFLLLKNSVILNRDILFFKKFKNLLLPVLLIYSPVIMLFAMGYDWGRWVNISYVFGIITFFYLQKKRMINISKNLLTTRFYKLLNNKKIFIIIFVIFCLGWNPKTVITGDIATNPLWKIPYNASKYIFGFNNFRILQDSPISIWHRKYVE